MASSTVMMLILVAILCIAIALPISQAMSGGAVPATCCNGIIRNVNGLAKTTADRQAACNCLAQTDTPGSIPGLNPNLAAMLPGKCGVTVPYKISTSTNCASVK